MEGNCVGEVVGRVLGSAVGGVVGGTVGGCVHVGDEEGVRRHKPFKSKGNVERVRVGHLLGNWKGRG